MLGRMLMYSIIAILAAANVGGIAADASQVAKIPFFFLVILFAVSLVVGLVRGRGKPSIDLL